tara:strand:+ start:251 stop:412 length:162 start_codon:yes stop_codon:yes gene_type:complete
MHVTVISRRKDGLMIKSAGHKVIYLPPRVAAHVPMMFCRKKKLGRVGERLLKK